MQSDHLCKPPPAASAGGSHPCRKKWKSGSLPGIFNIIRKKPDELCRITHFFPYGVS